MHDQIMHGTLFNPFGYSRFRATSCTLRFQKSTGLNNYSWVRKGSSKGFGSLFYRLPYPSEDNQHDNDKGYEEYPLLYADLMKYYIYEIPNHEYYADENDVKGLIWLCRMTLGERV